MEEKYLPIGSIVTVKDINKKLMIIGYYSLEYKNSVKLYDYVGCSYPEGMLLKNNTFSFNDEPAGLILLALFIPKLLI